MSDKAAACTSVTGAGTCTSCHALVRVSVERELYDRCGKTGIDDGMLWKNFLTSRFPTK